MSKPVALHQPIVSPILVGREGELALLDPLLARARAGNGATVLVSGEAGIGKSRLVSEVGRRFGSAEGQPLPGEALTGRCFEPDRALPFAPFLDLLRGWLGRYSPAEVVQRVGSAAPEFRRLLPELTAALQDAPALPEIDPEEERRRIFRALLDFLAREAAHVPLLLVIEDLHWSDDTSLELLLQIARRVPELPILMVLTYRVDEVQPALRHLLSMLDRERLASELALARLSLGESETMLRAIFDQPHPIRRDFLLEIHTLTDGNPFFIEEVIRSLMMSGDIYEVQGRWQRKEIGHLQIPRSVQAAVQRRSEGLSSDVREILRIAAVAGQRFEFEVLAAVSARDERALLRDLRALIDAQLVVEETAERFGFRHALTRQAVYGDLLARERRALHRALGEAIERLYSGMLEPYLAELAYHYHSAEDWEKTLEYARWAGERAEAVYAPDAAIEHFGRALDAAAHLGFIPPYDLLRRRALARATLGQFEQAERDHQAGLDAARQRGDRLAEWQSRLDLGELWAGRDYHRAGLEFESALELARSMGDQLAEARTFLRIGSWYVNTSRPDDARAALAAALAGFERVGDEPGVAMSHDLLGIVADLSGDVALMRTHLNQALAHYRTLDDRTGMASVLTTLSCAAGASIFDADAIPPGMTIAEALACGAEGLALARQIGWRSGEAYGLLVPATTLAQLGRFAEALEMAEAGWRIADEIEHREWSALGCLAQGTVLLDLLEIDEARGWLVRARDTGRASGATHFLHAPTAKLAQACIAAGDLDAAVQALDPIDQQLPFETIGQRVLWLARGEVALATGNPATALDIAERLFGESRHATQPGDIPHVTRLHGDALAALERLDEAELALRAALDGATAREMRPLLWRIQLALADVSAALGRDAEASEWRAQARETVDWLAEQLPDPGRRERFVMRALALFPIEESPPSTERALLTTREWEVARLIADGLSNREIGEALFVGARTVETHVGHILSKLGFGSRAQIAAWVVEQRTVASQER